MVKKLFFAASLLAITAFAENASALTLTVTYHGAVTLVQDSNGVFGGAYTEGDAIDGSIVIHDIPTTPVFNHKEPGSTANAFEAPGQWQAGAFADTGLGYIQNIVFFPNSATTDIGVTKLGDPGGPTFFISTTNLTFLSGDALTPQLLSLASFPADKAAIAALWNAATLIAEGHIYLTPTGGSTTGASAIYFDIENAQFTVTPIPSTFLLFATTLGGLVVSLRRRNRVVSADSAQHIEAPPAGPPEIAITGTRRR